jgi:perosamine synthetase
LPNINAALGCAQLEQLPGFVDAKRKLHARYLAAFAGIPQVRILSEPAGCCSNYWLQTLLLDDSIAGLRDALLQATNDAGLMTRPIWELMSKLQPYRTCPSMPLPVAESLERRVINLPSSASLGAC